jgi:hypothetical protein
VRALACIRGIEPPAIVAHDAAVRTCAAVCGRSSAALQQVVEVGRHYPRPPCRRASCARPCARTFPALTLPRSAAATAAVSGRRTPILLPLGRPAAIPIRKEDRSTYKLLPYKVVDRSPPCQPSRAHFFYAPCSNQVFYSVNRKVSARKKPAWFTGETSRFTENLNFRFGLGWEPDRFRYRAGPVPPGTGRTGLVPAGSVNPDSN